MAGETGTHLLEELGDEDTASERDVWHVLNSDHGHVDVATRNVVHVVGSENGADELCVEESLRTQPDCLDVREIAAALSRS